MKLQIGTSKSFGAKIELETSGYCAGFNVCLWFKWFTIAFDIFRSNQNE